MSRDPEYALGLFGVLAMVIVLPLGLAVLSDPAVALKLENGTLSPCTDMSGARKTAMSRVVAAGSAVVAVFASDKVIPIMLVSPPVRHSCSCRCSRCNWRSDRVRIAPPRCLPVQPLIVRRNPISKPPFQSRASATQQRFEKLTD